MNQRAAGQLFLCEMRLFLREPFAFFFTLLFPLLLLLVLGTSFGQFPAVAGFRVVDVLVPSIISTVAAYLGLMAIPIIFAEHRELGILRRFRATPLTFGTIVAVHTLVEFLMLMASATLLVLLGRVVFQARFGGNAALVVAVLLLGAVSLFSVGFALAGLVKTSRTAQAVGAVFFFPMMFTSGAALPREQFPPWLQEVTDFLPLTRVVETLTPAWTGEPLRGFQSSLVILLGIAVVAIVIARAAFRWD